MSNEPAPAVSAVSWDRWWTERLAQRSDDFFPMFPAPLLQRGRRFIDVVNSDIMLVQVMRHFALKTMLCAGNGVSQEPRALAAAGLEVTALDLSPLATAKAHGFDVSSRDLTRFVHEQQLAPGGCVHFVAGDLMDPAVCPGPFDVVIERRTIQRFPENERGAALAALACRLGETGIFVSHCNDDQFPEELGWMVNAPSGLFHASEAWLRETGWPVWEGLPDATLKRRVAWLLRSGTMKRRPVHTP